VPYRSPVGSTVETFSARNETEAFQLVLHPLGVDLKDVRVDPGPLVGPGGATIGPDAIQVYMVGYVKTPGPSNDAPVYRVGWWPDPLLPKNHFPLRYTSQPVWIEITTPADAAPGDYSGVVTISAGEDATIAVPVNHHVWDFVIPHQQHLRNAFFLRVTNLSRYYYGDPDYRKWIPLEDFQQVIQFYNTHRITIQVMEDFRGDPQRDPYKYALPWVGYLDIDYSREPREYDFTAYDALVEQQLLNGSTTIFAGFTVSTHTATERTRSQEFIETHARHAAIMQEHLEERGWLEQAYIYLPDEAKKPEEIAQALAIAEAFKKSAPKLKRLAVGDYEESLVGHAEKWCGNGIPDADGREEGARAWSQAGAEQWWYLGCTPRYPFPNFFIDQPATANRLFAWLSWKYHKQGFLYWGVMAWADRSKLTWDGAEEGYPLSMASKYGNGDGMLSYPGDDLQIWPSIRLKLIRDGMEDYEYFWLLQQALPRLRQAGRDDLVATVSEALLVDQRIITETQREDVSRSNPNFHYCQDPVTFLTVRRELGDLVELVQKAVTP